MRPESGAWLYQDQSGVRHCYAETFAELFGGVAGHPYELGFDLRLVPGKLADPLRWRKPKMIRELMSDLFHDDVPDDHICEVARIMSEANWHTYQVLTKRAARMADLLRTKLQFVAGRSNIWWASVSKIGSMGFPDRRPAVGACPN
jgi:protein gp37